MTNKVLSNAAFVDLDCKVGHTQRVSIPMFDAPDVVIYVTKDHNAVLLVREETLDDER